MSGFLLAAAIAAGPAGDVAGKQKILAVLEIRNMLPAEEKARLDAAYFSDVLRTNVLELAPSLQVMTRENILVMLEASGKKLAECEGECEVDTGRRLGADLVISGEIYRLGPTLRLNLRLHDTHAGALLAGAQAEGAGPSELDKSVRPACAKLLARFSGGPARPPAGAFIAPVRIWTDVPGAFAIDMVALNGSFSCASPIERGKACSLQGPQPGIIRGMVRGDAAFSSDFFLKPEGGQYRIQHRGYTPLVLSSIALAVGIGATLYGYTASDGPMRLTLASASAVPTAALVAGPPLIVIGLVGLIVDLAKGHSWELSEGKEPPPPRPEKNENDAYGPRIF
jgi:TolB-like protein